MKLLFFFLFPIFLFSQNEIEVLQTDNEICFIDKLNPDAEWYQYYVQNADDLSQYSTWWSKTTDTCVVSPYCNNRCSRIAFINQLPIFSNIVETSTVDITVNVEYYSNQLRVDIQGNWDKCKVRLYNIWGNPLTNTIVWLQPSTIFIPIPKNTKNSTRVLVVEYEKGDCKGVLTKIIYY